MKRTSEYTTEEKRNLIELGREKKIKLNGQSAIISGAKLIEGRILNFEGTEAYFAWGTIERIVNSHGNFKS